MTPVPCISEPGEFGDCWRACIATILDLCTSDVPHFFALAGAGTAGPEVNCNAAAYRLGREWLREQGLGIFRAYESGRLSLDRVLENSLLFSPDVPIILHGTPALASVTDPAHAVVIMNGVIVHDPSGLGVGGGPVRCDCADPYCKGWWWIDVITVGENWQCGALAG